MSYPVETVQAITCWEWAKSLGLDPRSALFQIAFENRARGLYNLSDYEVEKRWLLALRIM